jgi:hypothetical protein
MNKDIKRNFDEINMSIRQLDTLIDLQETHNNMMIFAVAVLDVCMICIIFMI